MKPTGKKYDIDSFEQLINVMNKDNFESITMDFLLWMGYVMQVMEASRKAFPEETKDKTNWEIAQCHFIWTDDGVNEAKSVTIKNTTTGEVTTLNIKSS